jgi:hypothetical protein
VNDNQRPTPIKGDDIGGEEGRKSAPESQVYQIRVKGHLDASWSEWFEGLSIVHEVNGVTVLTGPVADQPALHRLLAKVCNLGLPLVSVNCVKPNKGEVTEDLPDLEELAKARKSRNGRF